MNYRPEIDGLRSIAVIPVVLFHAGFTSFSGGFVGVDIFFVISGYLISGIIISEIQTSTFSFLNFYERRIRRILPTLSVVILASLISALFLSLPDQLLQTSKSSIFALLGVSNIFFWTESGYFAPASEFQMLLHTWSLGVEEQFYFFLPPMLLLILRVKLPLKVVLATGLPLLFGFGLWLSFNKPSVAFYLLPARAWELSLGVALAAGTFPKLTSLRANSAIAIFGLMAIIASVLLIDKSMPFPGWAALLPCLGTAAIIHCATNTNMVGRLLSLPPLRFVGLISYSLYLWHWPVLVTLRFYTAEPHLDPTIAFLGVGASTLLAAATWKCIENPFRSKTVMPAKWMLLGISGPASLTLVIGIASINNSGFPERLNDNANRFISAANDIDSVQMKCQGLHRRETSGCQFGNHEANLSFAIMGDSHAGAIRPALESWATDEGKAGTIFWHGACPMLVGATKVPEKDGDRCATFKNKALEAVLANPDIGTIFISGRWEAAYTGKAPEVGGSFRTYLIDAEEPIRTPGATKRVFKRSLVRTADTLVAAGKKVVFLGSVPEVGFDVPRILALAAHNQDVQRSKHIVRDNTVARELDAVFESIAARSENISYVSIWRKFCAEHCSLLLNGLPLYSDDDHLTYTAARQFIGPFITSKLNPSPNP